LRQYVRRAVAAVTVTAALSIGTTALAGPASAEPSPKFGAEDSILLPGDPWAISVYTVSHTGTGTMLFAVAAQPLTGEGGDAAGLPPGVTRGRDACTVVAGTRGVFACPVENGAVATPDFSVDADAADLTKVYAGYAFVPAGGDLAAGVRTAQTAGALPPADTYGTYTLTVFTAAHAAANTVSLDTPTVLSGGSARHTLRLHVVDSGTLGVGSIRPADEPTWSSGYARRSDLSTTSGAACHVGQSAIANGAGNLTCELSPGEQLISYTVTAPAVLDTRRIETVAVYDIYRHAPQSAGYPDPLLTFYSPFEITGSRAGVGHDLVVRTATGRLSLYHGTGNPAAPFTGPALVGSGWQVYGALTKLSPVTAAPASTGAPQSVGDLVGRDTSGVLWYYKRQFGTTAPFAPRTRVGAGWDIYTSLTGAGDLTGDGRADLLTRDRAGVLWLYRGTGSASVPFTPRTRVGGGWNAYSALSGSDDLTDDGRPDMVARDASGALWLYRGTANPTTPFAPRTRIGGGWNTYNQLL